VRIIIPPKPYHKDGLLIGGDALAQDVFEECKEYVNNPRCTVILFENPPYRDAGASDIKGKENSEFRNNYISSKMMKTGLKNKTVSCDLSNQFIWSAFEFYIKKKNDAYILFSPIKY
jgi:hypothetical protein